MQFYTLDNMNYDRFYALFDSIEPYNDVEDPVLCPECGRILIWRKWIEPRCVKLSKPLFGDVALNLVDNMIVSQRFKNLYEQSGLKGIKSFNPIDKVLVSRNAKKQLIPPMYYHIELEMANAVYDLEKTVCLPASYCKNRESLEVTNGGIKRCSLCNPYNYDCVPTIKGFGIKYLDNNFLDIFHFYPRTRHVHFSQKFIDWALENNITNFKGKIQKTEDYWHPDVREMLEYQHKKEAEHIERLKRGEEF